MKLMKESKEYDMVKGAHDYMQNHAIEEDNMDCNELRNWIIGCREFK